MAKFLHKLSKSTHLRCSRNRALQIDIHLLIYLLTMTNVERESYQGSAGVDDAGRNVNSAVFQTWSVDHCKVTQHTHRFHCNNNHISFY